MLVQHGKPPSPAGGSVWAWIKAVTETGNSDFCLCAAGLRVLKGSRLLRLCTSWNTPPPPADAERGVKGSWWRGPKPSGSVEMYSSVSPLWAGHKLENEINTASTKRHPGRQPAPPDGGRDDRGRFSEKCRALTYYTSFFPSRFFRFLCQTS